MIVIIVIGLITDLAVFGTLEKARSGGGGAAVNRALLSWRDGKGGEI